MSASAPVHAFRQFSWLHLAIVVAFVLVVVGLVMVHRALRPPGRQHRLDAVLAALCAIGWALVNGWYLLPSRFEIQQSLPIHICDLAGLVAPIALLTCARWSRAIMYFWGIGLSSQGFFSPDLRSGPESVGFWLFWLNHFIVVGVPIYDIAARGFRPGWKDFCIGYLGALAYVAIMTPVNAMFGLNYGYVGPGKPAQPSLIDYLGPWPGRVVVIAAIGLVAMILMTLPWVMFKKTRMEDRG